MPDDPASQRLRPQFHFSARTGWLNDPNGLVFYKGQYHLFYQHNPWGLLWGNMTWGHAVSDDLLHWKHLPNAIEPDDLGFIYSGSAAVDWQNSAGLQQGPEKTLVAFYTAAGLNSPAKADTQCIAYSNDAGQTWNKFKGNPVVPMIQPGNRDPKVIWHEPTNRWVMCLHVTEHLHDWRAETIHFLTSPDLKQWEDQSKIEGYFECPDLFELPVDGNEKDKRWVLMAADGRYTLGSFDGKRFTPAADASTSTSGGGGGAKHSSDWGGNFYAAQTYSDIPPADGRRIIVGWMRGGQYPDMPFNQQMAFPCTLSLRAFPEGVRLCKNPVAQIARLYTKTHEWHDITIGPGQNPLKGIESDLLDIEAEIEPGDAAEFGFVLRRSQKISYLPADQEIIALNHAAPLRPVNGRIKLRVLLDRASVEVFANDGRVTLSTCFNAKPEMKLNRAYAECGQARFVWLRVRELKSVWT